MAARWRGALKTGPTAPRAGDANDKSSLHASYVLAIRKAQSVRTARREHGGGPAIALRPNERGAVAASRSTAAPGSLASKTQRISTRWPVIATVRVASKGGHPPPQTAWGTSGKWTAPGSQRALSASSIAASTCQKPTASV